MTATPERASANDRTGTTGIPTFKRVGMSRRNLMAGVLRVGTIAILVCWWLGYGGDRVRAQGLPPPEDSRQSMLREAMLGVLPSHAGVASARAQKQCIVLP